MDKFCVNCKHCRLVGTSSFFCESPENPATETNLVTGKKEPQYTSCEVLRANDAFCGRTGRWFNADPLQFARQQEK